MNYSDMVSGISNSKYLRKTEDILDKMDKRVNGTTRNFNSEITANETIVSGTKYELMFLSSS